GPRLGPHARARGPDRGGAREEPPRPEEIHSGHAGRQVRRDPVPGGALLPLPFRANPEPRNRPDPPDPGPFGPSRPSGVRGPRIWGEEGPPAWASTCSAGSSSA